MSVKSIQELYDIFITELQAQAADLTDTNEGSIIDVTSGTTVIAVNEILQLTADEFKKTFFDTAHGPEITGGIDDLENLAIDHFGDSFARPEATFSLGTVTFSRPTAAAGNVVIPIGTVVKTAPDANGVAQRFVTEAEVTMITLSISASVNAALAGTGGNVQTGTVTIIEDTLTDPTVVVTNSVAFSGGAPVQSDADYRETIRNLVETLRGASAAAITAAALLVPGVEMATASEFIQYVKEWDIAGNAPIGAYFPIPRVKLYITDANGTASAALIAAVVEAVALVRAAGVFITVLAGSALSMDWTWVITLNPSGPNYATLLTDGSMIEDTMRQYIQNLDIGADFTITTANAAIFALWGPSGTNDLTAFSTTIPIGSIATAANQKLIPGAIII